LLLLERKKASCPCFHVDIALYLRKELQI
jgi:hypothetical protein